MGLLLPLSKTKNTMYYDFDQAYWAINDLMYSETACGFTLNAYPSREAKLMNNTILDNPTIGFGSSGTNVVDSILYTWNIQVAILEIFPSGIPLNPDEQKTAIYNWIKDFTGLPFEDVLEE